MQFSVVRSKLMKVILAASARDSVVGVQQEKSRYLILKRGGKVCTKIIADASSATLYPIIECKVVPGYIVYSDSWRGYNVLNVSDFKLFRINHSKLFTDKKNHINGIENFGTRPSITCASLMVFPDSILGYF
mgnify:CR=1 FL=1